MQISRDEIKELFRGAKVYWHNRDSTMVCHFSPGVTDKDAYINIITASERHTNTDSPFKLDKIELPRDVEKQLKIFELYEARQKGELIIR
jgi:hypothetical protein